MKSTKYLNTLFLYLILIVLVLFLLIDLGSIETSILISHYYNMRQSVLTYSYFYLYVMVYICSNLILQHFKKFSIISYILRFMLLFFTFHHLLLIFSVGNIFS